VYIIEADRKTFGLAKEQLQELYPFAEISLISCDDALERLGFVDSAPCVFGLDVSREQLDTIFDDLIQMEIDAFNTEDGDYPESNDPYYLKYITYGWLYDLLFYAHEENDRQ